MYPNCGPEHLGANLVDAPCYASRREFLNHVGTGFGALALVGLLRDELVPSAGAQSAGGLLAPKDRKSVV